VGADLQLVSYDGSLGKDPFLYPVRIFALVMGVIFVLVGIFGFVPALVTHPIDAHTCAPTTATCWGLITVNLLHNLVHIVFRIWGIAAYLADVNGCRLFARSVTVIYALLAVMGLFPRLDPVFGLIPIHGNDTWLHGLIAWVSAYFGWAPVAQEPTTTTHTSGTPLSR
jgi:hypothetical protein